MAILDFKVIDNIVIPLKTAMARNDNPISFLR